MKRAFVLFRLFLIIVIIVQSCRRLVRRKRHFDDATLHEWGV